MGYLDKAEVNTGRQLELDIARGLAVLFMVMIHIQEYFSDIYAKEGVIGTVIDFLGGIPAAPVFMILMGIGFVYSKRSTAEILLKRGLIILITGYVLNLLRGSLPYLFQYMIYGSQYSIDMALTNFIYVDIFQFSGLAMIFFAFVKKYNFKEAHLFISMLIFSLINQMMSYISVDSFALQGITGLIWGSSEYSFFPFLTWIFYPIIGFIFGKILLRVTNKEMFYLRVILVGYLIFFGLILLGNIFGVDSMLFSDELYYHHRLFGNIIAASFVFAWIGSMFYINKILNNSIRDILKRWSNNVTEIYFIHWVILGWSVQFLGNNYLSLPYVVVLFIGVLVVSDFLSDYYLIKKRQNPSLSQ